MPNHLIEVLHSAYDVQIIFDNQASKKTMFTYAYKYALSNNMFVLTYRQNQGRQIITLVNY